MKAYQVRPRSDWMDMGDRPHFASAIFTDVLMAKKFGEMMWGRFHSIREIEVDEEVFE